MPATTSSTTHAAAASPTDIAIQRLCAANLHQVLWLPANESRSKRLRVTFSTTGNFSDASLPAILFCGPMFGGRYASVDFDHLARKHGVRVISVDRPGMGGSERVQLHERIPTWLETVRLLLEKLGLRHVSLMSHSAGTMFALNTLYSMRDILDPEAPYVGFIAPWVHNAHSQATLMNLVSKIPNSWIGSWNQVQKFVSQRVAPSAAWSGGIISSVTGLFQEDNTEVDADVTAGEKYGTSDEAGREIETLLQRYYHAEDTTAGNEEARLCLKKSGLGDWLACEDYEDYVRKFTAGEKERRRANPEQWKLRVRVYFAESDIMIGKGGQEYFERCWRQEGVEEVMEFRSVELGGTNHDSTIIDQKKGALARVFEEVAKGVR